MEPCARKDFLSSLSKTPLKKRHIVFSEPPNYAKSTLELAWPEKPLELLQLAAKACESSSGSTSYSLEKYRLIGANQQTGEWILQIKDISPSGIRSSLAELNGLSGLIEQARLSPWTPAN